MFWLIVVIVVIVIVVYKKKKKANTTYKQHTEQHTSTPVSKSSYKSKISSSEVANAQYLMKQLNESTNIVNSTTNPKTYFGRVNFIYDTLMELTKYEKYGIYTGSTPTADIEKLNRDLESSVNAFVDRAYEAQLIKVCNLKTEKGKLNSLEKFFDSMYAAFDCANTFWSGNGVRAHYTGPLITAGNRAYLDALHEDCMKAYGIDQDMTPLINKVSHKASKSELVFDDTKEKELIAEYNKYKNTSSSGAYYAALPLIDFYYKYRSLDKKYLILCMEYCNICISLLNIPDMQQYVSEGIVIPAFKKLVIIYDKKKEYKKALEIIDKAIKYDRDTDYYEKKRAAILKKMIK